MPAWNTATCEANGIQIHYTRTGGNLPAILLLHGLTANGTCWTLLARELEKEYNVIMPDARGHGLSSAPASGYRYEDHASDVVGLIRALGLSSPILVGHSMGGMTAAVVAGRNPDLLRGLILADPSFLSPDVQRDVRDSDVADQHRQFLRMSLHEIVADARRKHPDRSPELIELLAQARLQTRMSAFDVLTPPNPDYSQLVRSIEVPTLLVTAEHGVVPSTVAVDLQGVNPKIQVETILKAGHGLHYDQPERFAAVVNSFLRSLEKG